MSEEATVGPADAPDDRGLREEGGTTDANADGRDASVPEPQDADANVLADVGAADDDRGTPDSDAADAGPTEAGTDATEATDAETDGEAIDAGTDAGATDAGTDANAIDASDDGDAGEAPFDNASCLGLPLTCGAANNRDCCHRSTIPGGAFFRSYDGVGFTDTSHGATISSFALDTFEVTVGRFRAFVGAGFGTRTKPPATGSGAVAGTPASGWSATDNSSLASDTTALATALSCSAAYQTWTDTPASNEARPINCVTWYEAFAFCIWDGARLPTEAEWNYAAAGGAEQRVYPWSVPASATSISDTNASYWLDPTKQCYGDGVAGCSLADLLTVGSKQAGRGRFGQADLAGNVWEWTRDTFENPYSNGPCTDCVELSRGDLKVIRGGSFFGTPSTLLASGRSQGMAATRNYTVGIRCAR